MNGKIISTRLATFLFLTSDIEFDRINRYILECKQAFTLYCIWCLSRLIDQNIPEPNYRQQSDLNPDDAATHPFFGAKKPFINVTADRGPEPHLVRKMLQSKPTTVRLLAGVMLYWANGCGFWSINYFHKNMIAWSEWGILSQGSNNDQSDEWFRSIPSDVSMFTIASNIHLYNDRSGLDQSCRVLWSQGRARCRSVGLIWSTCESWEFT